MREILKIIISALVFGGLYLMLTAGIPFGYRFSELVCGDFEDAFKFGTGHFTLAFCAGLSFFASAWLKGTGWNVFFKTVAVSYLCFQIYSVQQIYDFIFLQQCYFPLSFSRVPLSDLLRFFRAGLAINLYWAGSCLLLLLIYRRVLPIFTDLGSTGIQKNV